MLVERDDLMSQEVSSPPATPPSPMTNSKQDEKALKRFRTIQELYETEKDYHNELQALVEMVLPSFKKVILHITSTFTVTLHMYN